MTGFTETDIRAGTIVKPEMDTLLAGLTDDVHARKYKLVPMLRGIW